MNELTFSEGVVLLVWVSMAVTILLVTTVSVAQVDALNLR